MARIGTRFARSGPRQRAGAFVQGLLAGAPRANGWSIAEHAGEHQPRGMQRLLANAVWEHAVYLGYATTVGYTLIDYALYLPKVWTGDVERVRGGRARRDRVRDQAGAGRGDAHPGPGRRGAGRLGPPRRCRQHRHTATRPCPTAPGHLLAIAKTHPVTTGIGTRHAVDYAVRPDLRWHTYSAGPARPRTYQWTWIEVTDPALTDTDQRITGQNWLLIRRHPTSGELAFYRAHATGSVALTTRVAVTGSRWRIKDSFAGAKELAALDQHQVRTWTAWHRRSLLAMIAQPCSPSRPLTKTHRRPA